MLTIIFLILITAGLTGIIIIVVRRLPDLAAIDVETIAEKKQKAVKENILIQRLRSLLLGQAGKFFKFLRPLQWNIRNKFRALYRKVLEMEREYKVGQVKKEEGEGQKVKVEELLQKAKELTESANYLQAEALYIEMIKLDNQNLAAYQGLADLYLEQKDWEHGREVCQYILRINPKNSEAWTKLSDICQANNEAEQAWVYCRKALKYEPNNPKLLDNFLELSIILKDKITAKEIYQRLKKVNPENQKLEDFRKRINAIRIKRVGKGSQVDNNN